MEKEKFRTWMKRGGLSNSTVSSYVNTLELFERDGFRFSYCLRKQTI